MSAPAPPGVVVHIPHASLVVPSDFASGLLLTPKQLGHELIVMTDRYTDELFALPSRFATAVAFPVSRLVVDPERFAEDSPGVVQFVARGDESDGVRRPANVSNVCLLALSPRRLRQDVGVAARLDDLGDRSSEPFLDECCRARAALIFDGIMKDRRDRLVLRCAMLQSQARDREQVRDVRDLGSLPSLRAVETARERQSLGEACRKRLEQFLFRQCRSVSRASAFGAHLGDYPLGQLRRSLIADTSAANTAYRSADRVLACSM